MQHPLSPKQLEFIINSTKHWNLAHGSVRSGKTVCTAFRFMQAVDNCPDSKIFIVGHTFDTAYRNVIRLLMESEELSIFRPFLTWSGKKLYFKDKVITVLGAKDEGAIGNFQGDTYSLVYCDEITLYPQSIIEMINSRLSKAHSMGFAAMNPKHPTHIMKQWIDLAEAGDPKYYALHFTVDDNPYLPEHYKQSLRDCETSLFYKRNYLGLWCVAEGSVFDFFDRDIHMVSKPPEAAEYWIAGIDFGTSNAFACVLIGVSTGKYTQTGKKLWIEKEYYWDCRKKGRQQTNSEFARDVQEFLEPYAVNSIYIDPSAASMKLELRRRNMHVIDANNDVYNGIQIMINEMAKGNLFVCSECTNLIREIESYVWDTKKSEKGEDAPLKKSDHAIDALRYAIASHRVVTYDPYENKQQQQKQYLQNRFDPTPTRRF
jgi:PBSX family phage terminase large subunit